MKYGSISHHLRPRGRDYRALFVAVVEWNGSVDDRVRTVAADQQKVQTTINLAVNTKIHSQGGCVGVEDVRMDAIVQWGPFECTAATDMADAKAKAMRLGLGDLAWAQQLFDIEVFADVV